MVTAIKRFSDTYLSGTEKLFGEYPLVFSPEDAKIWREQLLSLLLGKRPKTHVFVITRGDDVIGAILFHEDEHSQNGYFEIDWLVVKKEFLNNGFGKLLMTTALKRMRDLEGNHVFLRTSGSHYNEETRVFYERMGFRKLANLPHYYSADEKHDENGVIFYRAL